MKMVFSTGSDLAFLFVATVSIYFWCELEVKADCSFSLFVCATMLLDCITHIFMLYYPCFTLQLGQVDTQKTDLYKTRRTT